MLKDNRVWLIRHTYLSGWFLPGGGLKRNETLEEAMRREAFEETGAELGDVKLLGMFSNFVQWKSDHTAAFFCGDFKITGKPDGEIAEIKSFPLDNLPQDIFRSHRSLLEGFINGITTPQLGIW